MVAYRHAPASVATTTKAISTKTTFGKCGKTNSSHTAIANGCVKTNVPTARFGNSAKATECTSATPTENSNSAITKNYINNER